MAEISIRILIMFIWEKNIKMPDNVYNQLIDAIGNETSYYNRYDGSSGLTNATYENTQNEYFTSFFDDSFHIEGLYDFYSGVIKEMMGQLGMWDRSRYHFELWTQRYNIGTTSHLPHDHFSGCEIISFNHIIDATEKKCFYFQDDDENKIYPGKQDRGHFFAWPPWRIHGADKVTEPNVNRLIVAGNISLTEYYDLEDKRLVCHEPEKHCYVWRCFQL